MGLIAFEQRHFNRLTGAWSDWYPATRAGARACENSGGLYEAREVLPSDERYLETIKVAEEVAEVSARCLRDVLSGANRRTPADSTGRDG